jgi:hypothetical protein
VVAVTINKSSGFQPVQYYRLVNTKFRIDTWRNVNGTERIVLFDHAINTNVDLQTLTIASGTGVTNNGTGVILKAEDANFGSASNGWFTTSSGTLQDFSQYHIGAYTNGGTTNTTITYMMKLRPYTQ